MIAQGGLQPLEKTGTAVYCDSTRAFDLHDPVRPRVEGRNCAYGLVSVFTDDGWVFHSVTVNYTNESDWRACLRAS